MIYRFKTPDHPTARDRTPEEGETAIVLHFPTDDEGMVEVHMGMEKFTTHAATILSLLKDDHSLRRQVEKEAKTIKPEIG